MKGPRIPLNSVENGIEPGVGNGDEIMAKVKENEFDEGMTIDMETIEETARSSEAYSTSTFDP